MQSFKQFSESVISSATKKMAKAKDAREYEAAANLKMAAIRQDQHKSQAQGSTTVANHAVGPHAKIAADDRAKDNKDSVKRATSDVRRAREKADVESKQAAVRRQQETLRRSAEKQRDAIRKKSSNAVAKY